MNTPNFVTTKLYKGDRLDLWLPQAQTHALEKVQISHGLIMVSSGIWRYSLQYSCHANRNTSSRKNTEGVGPGSLAMIIDLQMKEVPLKCQVD